MMMYHQTKFGSQKVSNSENIRKETYFDHTSLHCDLDLEDSHQFSCTTLWLMMLHYNNKSGNKMFRSSEDIIWMNIH